MIVDMDPSVAPDMEVGVVCRLFHSSTLTFPFVPLLPLLSYYKELMVQGFKTAHAHAETVICLMEIMSFQSKFPCFVKVGPAQAIAAFKARLCYGQTLSDAQIIRIVDGLVARSYDACGTRWYDKFQLWTNGIMP